MNGVGIPMQKLNEMDVVVLTGPLLCHVGREMVEQTCYEQPCTLHLSNLLLFDGKLCVVNILLLSLGVQPACCTRTIDSVG